jgi:hypothetical protein
MTPDLLTEVRAIHRELVAIRSLLERVAITSAGVSRSDLLAAMPTIQRVVKQTVRRRTAGGSDE